MKNTIVIGVTGASGSGKTTFSNKLKEHLNSFDVQVLTQDDYYRPIESQHKDLNGVENFDLPGAMNLQKFSDDIKTLIKGESINVQKYQYNKQGSACENETITPCTILIVEGIFLLYPSFINEVVDMTVFVSSDLKLSEKRRINRDSNERGYTEEDVRYRFKHHVLPMYKEFIEPYVHLADEIVENTDNFDEDVERLSKKIEQTLL